MQTLNDILLAYPTSFTIDGFRPDGIQNLIDNSREGLGNSLGDAAADAGEGVGVTAEGDGFADGVFEAGGVEEADEGTLLT